MDRLIIVFIFLSLVSLTADVAYEGGRSISGQFLEHLRAPAIAAGLLALGEFLGYALRLPASLVVSMRRSSKLLWSIIILGYALVVAIPFLAFVNNWYIALLLYLIERIGKGLRSPARDVLIADITDKAIGRGKGFGIHELLDQVGALLGPLMVSYALTYGKGYSYAYVSLLPIALIAVILITISSFLYPNIGFAKNGSIRSLDIANNRSLKTYMIFTALLSFGLIHWGIASYHLKYTHVVPEGYIPALYAIAMIVDALVALPLGIAYDRYGVSILILIPLASMFIAPLMLISRNIILLVIASALYGIVLCSYESVLRAAVADIASSASERALGFGWLGFVWGTAWATGNIIGGALYDFLGPQVLCILYPVSSFLSLIYFIKYYLQ